MWWFGAFLALAIGGTATQPVYRDVSVAPRYHAPYSSVVVFGDSLVDNGNGTWQLTNHTWPADKAYFDGRFSNGETWVEVFAEKLGVPCVKDIAYGGATVNNSRVQGYTGYDSDIKVPDVLSQISQHLGKSGCADADALYIVSGGSNDAFFGMQHSADVAKFAESVVESLVAAAHRLARAGARHLAIPTLLPTGLSPYGVSFLDDASRATLRNYTDAFNKAVNATTNITVIDLHTVAQRIYDNPAKHGLTVLHEACLQGTLKPETGPRKLCSNPDAHTYWDLYHPTKRMHELLAEGAFCAFSK
ncbi:hypothetical protein MCUN1_001866 [Malassezia cuniculi]|uniref:Uncharacterized protein n=1 Tax=Malassezia cuniculi TaxID=948313 RepID=A0AAF0ER99_9BASI|nr:hypothetical protein MCUN1_001866 [Malassezia cuniculi]